MNRSSKNTPSPQDKKQAQPANPGQPGALRRINIERIVRKIQTDAPITRTDLVEHTGLSYPTVMKICDLLLENNFIEWVDDDPQEPSGRGRPASYIQMASSSSHVIALSFRPSYILGAVATLNGKTVTELQCPIPDTYPEILSSAHQLIKKLQKDAPTRILGIGLAAPGLLETGTQAKLAVSANIPALTDHYIAEDLSELTHLPSVIVSTMRSLYHSEIIRGYAIDHKNFAILNYYAGMGVAVADHGHFVEGSRGMAGELGHIIIERGGELCGCGNRGCLETRATDLALAHAISKNLGHPVSVDEMIELIRKSPSRFEEEIDSMLNYLAIAVGLTINLFNPEAVLLYGRLLDINPIFFEKLQKKVPACSLKNLADNCSLKKSKSRTIEGAALAIVDELIKNLSNKD
ncbi:MAG: ROK family protein [Verrucomicrobiales bacterium]|nr:ROK family protein [Verrucomicrobiales bacterium]